MNIFFTEHTYDDMAKSLHDVHLRKMMVETAQMICTNLVQSKIFITNSYKPTHIHHPCVKWVNEASANMNFIINYFIKLCDEYMFRFNKTHLCDVKFRNSFNSFITNDLNITTPPMAMPDIYRGNNVVESYRNYYINEKQYDKNGKFICKYTKRDIPIWLKDFYGNINK